MTWFLVVAALAVVVGTAALVLGAGGGMSPADRPPVARLPEGDLVPADLRRARFTMVVRGYDPDEVDALLDRVAQEWQVRLDAAQVPLPADVAGQPRDASS